MAAAVDNIATNELKSLQDKITVEHEAAPSIADGIVTEKIAIDTVEAEHEYTAAEYRRLLWKIDLWLLPLVSEHRLQS
jgi:hypothetical protein